MGGWERFKLTRPVVCQVDDDGRDLQRLEPLVEGHAAFILFLLLYILSIKVTLKALFASNVKMLMR